ncbi:GNAT family N-acetyltransferase [Vibrio sonorensis]|uniref:GNAT family N-acetyltransferase n=1 Tax=Vibrio sonorensis TaxID=1004316 RepID=UPI0008DB0069|nr:GNAT family N-acetyltransferase [Vibrio sonorensis]
MIKKVLPEEVPISLLLEADPDKKSIASYLDGSDCYVVEENGQTVAACVLKAISSSDIELFNISVSPSRQGEGLGKDLLSQVIERVKADKCYRQMVLGTGTFGYQLTFYQKLGFRVTGVLRNHFLDNYPEPIFEHGLQHKDMLRLSITLNPEREE